MRLAQQEPQEMFTTFEQQAYEYTTEQPLLRAMVEHQELGAMVWGDQSTGTFVSDRWKLDNNLQHPHYKTFRSIRERWQVLNCDQSKCEVFRNRETAILFAKTCGWIV